jgi:hypothetical protein
MPSLPSAPGRAPEPDPVDTRSALGPVPAAPTRTETRNKVGLTLPLELAKQIRARTREGYALADLVMVAYQDHRDRLLDEHQTAGPRRLVRHSQGRSPITISLSHAERAAIDTLAEHLGWARSHTVAALLDRHLQSGRRQ